MGTNILHFLFPTKLGVVKKKYSMALLVHKKNLKTLEQVTVYQKGVTHGKKMQGDANSKRVYKYLSVINYGHKKLKMYELYQLKYYQGEYKDKVREVHIRKVCWKEGLVNRNEYVRVHFDISGEVISYEDFRGNHWKEEWGVKLPFEVSRILKGVKTNFGIRIRKASYYSGYRLRSASLWEKNVYDAFLMRCITRPLV
jgi:hypothetical protein